MPSPIRVPIHQKLNSISNPTAAEDDANDAIAAYLTPLLVKHERHQPLVYEDLLESYEVAQAVAASSSTHNPKAQQEVRHLHESQLQAYEAYARVELTKLAESYECPSIEEGEAMPAYIERFVQSMKNGDQSLMGWRVSEESMEEVFWSKVKSDARKAYFKFKGQSIEKDKTAKTDGQTTDKVNAFEAAALGALVSKSESQDADMDNAEEDKGGDGEENDMADDDGEEEEEEEEEKVGEEENAEDDVAAEEGNEDDDDEGDEDGGEANEEDLADAAVEDNGTDVVPAKTPTTTKKRRRLPNGPLGGGGAGSANDGGKKQQPAKKQKTAKGSNVDTTGGAGRGGTGGGRGKGSKAGRGAGGGRGTRKRNRKKGTGAGAGGVA